MTGYVNFDDPYCHKGSSVLLNKRGIKSAVQLEEFEVAMFTLRTLEALPNGQFDPTHYCALHHHLFQDVYDWAGEYRTIRIAKGNAMFCYPEHIAEQMELLFAVLQTAAFIGPVAAGGFVAASARLLGELNAIHPFREGNGRTQLSFLFLLGHRAGHVLDMARIRPEPMLCAIIASFDGRLELLEIEIAHLLT